MYSKFNPAQNGNKPCFIHLVMDSASNPWFYGSMPHDDHSHSLLPSDPALRVKALETLLVEKGLVDPAALDEIIDTYSHKIGPQNGAKVVAKAWIDPDFRTKIRVWDSTAEIRYLVIPKRPKGTDGWSEEELRKIVTRDAMIGTQLIEAPA